MSKASNPTRPTATSAGVLQQISGLDRRDRGNLEKWGYPITELQRVAGVEDQVDAVDALLAIMLDRPGYEHNDRDLKMATRVSKTLKAPVNPRAMLAKQGKVNVVTHGYFSEGVAKNPGSGKTVILVFASVVLIIFLIAVVVVAFK
jgi:hypothetical protein